MAVNIFSFETLSSTNSCLLELSKNNANPWTVIWTKEQTQGKGYAGNVWKINARENLTFSFLLKTDLNYQELIYLNEWVAASIRSYLSDLAENVSVKWPNDIIVNNKKIGGILLENYKEKEVMNSIIGIGLNINQTDFEGLPKASSLSKETNKKYDIKEILSALMSVFEDRFELIESRKFEEIRSSYEKFLFKKDKVSSFRKKDNSLFNGIIRGIDDNGNLRIELEEEERSFIHKEVELWF